MSKLRQINLSYHEMRLMLFFLLEPVSLLSRQNIFNDKTRIENDKLKEDEELEIENERVALKKLSSFASLFPDSATIDAICDK